MIGWINKKRNQKGFTLIELVVVIAILGILAALAIPRLTNSRQNAAIAAHKANVRTIESAATLFMAETSATAVTGIGQLVPTYLDKTPTVPALLNNAEPDYDVTVAADGAIVVVPAANTLDPAP